MRQIRLLGAAAAAFSALALTPASSLAQSGGVPGVAPSPPPAAAESSADPTFYDVPFGTRELRLGMRGTDVKTLNWVLLGLALGTPNTPDFAQPTDGAVRSFQSSAGLAANGVVAQPTRKALAIRMRSQHASWYGPGLYGNSTACGQKLKKRTLGVAHKKLPCGTKVAFAYRGRWVRAKVIDRGPYIPGRKWDLTEATATQLGIVSAGAAKVKAVVAR
jgi:rare lipoprotein A (peptidoglycan hydrolase)